MQKELLEDYVKKNYSSYKISNLTGKAPSTVRYWLNKFELNTHPKREPSISKWNSLPWNDIQADYDNNGTYRSIKKKFKLNPQCIDWAEENGLLRLRTHEQAMELARSLGRCNGAKNWTQEAKEGARQRMLKRIQDNPENHPNRKLANNRSKMSFPEKVAFDYLVSKNILFGHNKYIKPYWVDFCIGNIIIEIDGKRWHNTEKDAIRDKNLLELGYKVYRFDSQKTIKDVTILDEVLNRI